MRSEGQPSSGEKGDAWQERSRAGVGLERISKKVERAGGLGEGPVRARLLGVSQGR